MKPFHPVRCFLSEAEIFALLKLQGWFIGKKFGFGDKTNFDRSSSEIALSISEDDSVVPLFDQPIPFYAVWQLGFSPMIARAIVATVNTEVFLVCHRPILIDDRRYVVGYDRRPFELVSRQGEKTEFPLGRIDLWDLDSLKQSSFPRWEGIKFRFVVVAP